MYSNEQRLRLIVLWIESRALLGANLVQSWVSHQELLARLVSLDRAGTRLAGGLITHFRQIPCQAGTASVQHYLGNDQCIALCRRDTGMPLKGFACKIDE